MIPQLVDCESTAIQTEPLSQSTFPVSGTSSTEVQYCIPANRSPVSTQQIPKDQVHDTAEAPKVRSPTVSRLHAESRPARAVKHEILAEWSGCVTDIPSSGMHFYATLTGIKGEGVIGEEEEASIPTSDVAPSDKELLKPGNFFRLCVVREVLPSGQPQRSTRVVFRRLPAYRQHDLEAAMSRGVELARGLRVE